MRRLIRRTSKKTGLPPGALVHVGERKVETAKVTIFDYHEDHLEQREATSIDECIPFKETPNVTWINISGIHDVQALQTLGDCYGIHPLVLEDILNTEQRPKMEDFGDYVFIVLKMLYLERETSEIRAEQISIILGVNFVISFQETDKDVFKSIRDRIRNARGRIRRRGCDYLAYALLDAVVDSYFIILETIGGRLEDIEDEIIQEPTAEILQIVYQIKRELIFLRKSVWPLREVLAALARQESDLIKQETVAYLRDVYDHTIQVADTNESFRDLVSGMHDTYLSSVSNRMNEVMKVLTIFATIFIPLTFIAGIYGMNFEWMPELAWHWSYPALWGVILVVGISMLLYFRSKRWL
ncbi:MAG: magnesium/cobalt transporter CorA [Armatimonadota bacterium]|nr:MAG: magnesium/cobalt transporter CorA [Armatimonadota bacterium]